MKYILKFIIGIFFILLASIAFFLNKFWKFYILLMYFLWSFKINKTILQSFKEHNIVIWVVIGYLEYKDTRNIYNLFNYDLYEFNLMK